ncbi:MAG: hypothetical protein HY259_03075 [Chloroflexi bacterium]|nr:hypothetical protein [Chloroflexota bacterium]
MIVVTQPPGAIMPSPMVQMSATPTLAPALTATPTTPPTPTLLPTPTRVLNTAPATLLEVGQSWRTDSVLLTLASVLFNDSVNCSLGVKFYLENLSASTIQVSIRSSQFGLQDNAGRAWALVGLNASNNCPTHENVYTASIAPGERYAPPGYSGWNVGYFGPLTDRTVQYVIITVNDLYHFNQAKWRIPINN